LRETMKKSTATVRRLLLLVLAFAGTVSASAADKTRQVEVQHRKEIDSEYAAQDKRLEQAEVLVKKGDYEKAIKVYTDVCGELDLKSSDVSSWKANKRLRDIQGRLQKIREIAGDKALRSAKAAFTEAKYNDAVSFAEKAIILNPDLTSDADIVKAAALAKQRGNEARVAMSADTANPKLANDKKEVARNLAMARTLFKNRKYEEARRKVEDVYKIDPFNSEAAYLASQIYKHYYTTGYHRHQADVQSMMAYEAWQWVEPVFLRDSASNDVPAGTVKAASNQGINAKLDRIVFPQVQFDQADITAVIEFLRRNKNYDLPDKEGVIIDFSAGAAQPPPAPQQQQPADVPVDIVDDTMTDPLMAAAAKPKLPTPAAAAAPAAPINASEIQVTLRVNNVTLRELLDYICFLTDLTYTVLPDRVAFGASGNDIRREVFVVTPDALNSIVAFTGGAPAATENADAAADPATASSGVDDGGTENTGALTTGKGAGISIAPDALKKFFGVYGVDFNAPGSAISYNRKGKILMANTQENIRRLDEVLRLINTPKPMVQIEVKSIEIAENDWQELGFNWSFGELGEVKQDGTGWLSFMGNNVNYRNDGVESMTPGLALLRSALSGVDSKLINNLNIFPDLFGSIKPFGSDVEFNLSLTINALDRSDRTETIAAPTVTVSNGETATAILGRTYYFPESWDELEIDTEGGDGDSGYSYSITEPTPEFGDSEDIGTTFTVTPNIKNDNYTINLALKPKITAFIGEESYYITVDILDKASNTEYQEIYRIWRPIISTRSLDVNVNVYDGETLVIGGLADSTSQGRLDKIPILGDIPFIGRLFQSHSEMSVRKNMLILVTARLVNDAGLPIRRIEANGGIPELNR